QHPASSRWDLWTVPNTLNKTSSRRQAQIREHAGPGASVTQGQAVARATARAKVASTPEKERESWHERAVAAGHRPHQVVAAALEGREPGEPTAGRGPAPDEIGRAA